MKGREAVVLETLFRIQRFLDDSTPMLVAVNQSEARKRLDDTAAQMGSLAVAQVEGSRTTQGETARQRQLRLTLRTVHMRPITVIASQKLREQPEFTKLLLPAFKVQGTRLTATARDMANAAVPHTDLFGKEGLAPEFVAELRGDGCTRGVDQDPRPGQRPARGCNQRVEGSNNAGPCTHPAARCPCSAEARQERGAAARLGGRAPHQATTHVTE